MGKKRRGQREYIFLLIAIGVIFCLQSCVILNKFKHNDFFVEQHKLIQQKKFDFALKRAQKLKQERPEKADKALFQMGVIYAHPQNPGRNYYKALRCFQILINKYPQSQFLSEAQIWAILIKDLIDKEKTIRVQKATIKELRRKIKNKELEKEMLQKQLEKIKEIDIGIEEKRRKLK